MQSSYRIFSTEEFYHKIEADNYKWSCLEEETTEDVQWLRDVHTGMLSITTMKQIKWSCLKEEKTEDAQWLRDANTGLFLSTSHLGRAPGPIIQWLCTPFFRQIQ